MSGTISVSELAAELDTPVWDLLQKLDMMNVTLPGPMAVLTGNYANRIRVAFARRSFNESALGNKRSGRTPLPKEVWRAWIPYENGGRDKEGNTGKVRPCVVVRRYINQFGVVEVRRKKPPSTDDYVELNSHIWNPKAEEPLSYVYLAKTIPIARSNFKEYRCNDCGNYVWERIKERFLTSE